MAGDLSSLLGSAGIGGAIGAAIVRLELDTKKYLGELKGAEAQTIASTNKSSSAVGSFGAFASKALLGVGIAAAAGAALSIKAAIEANEAHLKLQNTFQNNATLADSSVAAFERQADSIRDLTGVDDEAITTGQALLGSFKLTGQQVQQLTPLVVDLASKYDIDLQAAFKAVGKATSGSAGILSRYGIVLDKADLEADAFGTTLEGLGVAAGFAEDRAKQEPWRLLGAQFEEIAETIGQELLPILQDFSQILVDNIGVVEGAVDKLGTLLDIYKDIAAVSFAPWTIPGDVLGELGGKVDELNVKFPELQSQLDANRQKADLAAAGMTNLTGTMDLSRITAVSAGVEFGHLSKAGKEIADGLREDLPSIIGTVTTYKETFDLSPGELADITAEWVKIGKKMAADLRELAQSDLKPAMKQAISALPPEMRAAWADGNAKEKAAIERSIRQAYDIKDAMDRIANDALGAGRTVGKNIASGIALGITTSTELITVAAANAVHRAIEAANDAAKVKSPSEVMRRLGVNMMVGLANGISDSEQKAIDAAKAAIEKTIDAVTSKLDALKGRAGAFGSSISGGFSSFGDLSNLIGMFGPEGGGAPACRPGAPT